MSDKHTPGPWSAVASSVRAPHDIHTFTTICQCVEGMKTGEEVRANARLIAAAPELLQFAINIRDSHATGSWQHSEACTAISKATGAAS